MKPEEQRIAIAKVCGWNKIEWRAYEFWGDKDYAESRVDYTGVPPIVKSDGRTHGTDWMSMLKTSNVEIFKPIPDYLNDLNAMAKAENNILLSQRQSYWDNLGKICQHKYFTDAGITIGATCCISATATQRAEAFLKTSELWK